MMRKRIFAKLPFLVSLVLLAQLIIPAAGAFAETASGTMLPPSNLAHQNVTPDDVKLTWSPVYGATGYKVYEITDGQLLVLATVTSTSYSINNLAEGSYSYVVSTLSADGESGPCAPITVDIVYPDMAAPAGLNFTMQKGTDIVLNWGASPYTEKYNVYQLTAEGEKSLITSTAARTYTFVNAPAGEYSYAVSATNSLYGESPLSNTVDVSVTVPTMTAPKDLTFSIASGTDVTLRWTAVSYATNYRVYQMIDGQKVLKSTVTAASATFTKQPAGDYTYEVYSYSDRFGESAEGSTVSLTVSEVAVAAPTNFTHRLANGNDVILTWTAAAHATNYKIYQIVDGQPVLKSTVTGTTTTYTNHAAGNYVYEIRTYSDRYGESAEGSQVTVVVDGVTMTPPVDVTSKIVNGNDIVLNWSAVTNATNYKVYQIVGEQKVLKSTVNATTVTYGNMPAGEYRYEIHSNSTRFGESVEGTQVTFTLVHPTMAPPENLTQTIKSATEFSLSWTASSYATNYKVYQIVDGQKALKNTVTGTTISYPGMKPGQYSFEVHSYSSRFGESADGAKLTFTMDGQVMEAPASLTQTITNGNDVTLKWPSVQYATKYNVYQIIDGEKVLKGSPTGLSLVLSNQAAGPYTFVVHSFSTVLGESPEGAEVTFDLVHPTILAPGNLTSKILNGNDVVLTWAAASYGNSYKVYELINGEKTLKSTVTSLSATLAKQAEGDHIYVVHTVSTRFGESPEGARIEVTIAKQTMQPPANFTYTVTNGNDITLKWNSVTYATAYKIYQIVDGEPILKSSVTTTSKTFTNLPEGDYIYEVRSFSDRFGESFGSEVSFTLDFPTMQAPANLTQSIANGNDIVLKWNAANYATKYNVYQIIDGVPVLKSTVNGTTVTYTNSPEGEYTYEVRSISDRFGESAEGSEVSLSLVFPIMQAPASPTSTITNGNDITLRWTASAYATGYKVYQVAGGQMLLVKTQTGTVVTFTNLPEGNYSYEIHSYSTRFGESPAPAQLNFSLTWPVVQPPVLTGSVFNANNINFTWKAVTWANEYRLYKVIDGTRTVVYKGNALKYAAYNLSEDTHHYELTAFSTRFGESDASNRYSETIVYPIMEPPAATLKLLSETSARISWNFVTYANNYNVYEIIEGKPVLVAANVNNLSYTLTNLTYANHEYVVTSYSNSFGESEKSNVVLAKLIIDTTAPVTAANAPTVWTNQDAVVTLTATDDVTGVENTYYAVNDQDYIAGTSLTVSEEGITKVSFYSIDKVGNTEAVKTIFVKIDKSAPVTRASDTADWSKAAVVQLSVEDTHSGAYKTFYSINGSDYVEGTSFKVEQAGVNQVSFYSVDAAGNSEEAQSIELKVDGTAPETTADAPQGWTQEDVKVTLSATDTHSGVAKTFYSVNGSPYVEGTSLTVDKEGINEVSFYSVDVAGNSETVQIIEVKIDRTAPVTALNAPEGWTNQDASVTLNASDTHSGIEKTFYSINGSEFVEGTSFTIGKEGVNQVSFYSVDAAGNSEKAQTVEVKIDKAAPVTTSDAPEGWSKEDVIVNLKASDALSGVKQTYYAVDGSNYVEGTSVTVAKEGIHKVSFYSVDEAGNIETANSADVKIDKTAPIVSMSLNGEYSLGTSLPLTYTAKDDLSGIAAEKMTVSGPNSSNGIEVANGGTLKLDKPGFYNITVTVTDAAGLTTTINKQFVGYIAASIEVTPKVIKGNKGVFTVRVDLPAGFSSQGFELDTARVNGVKALSSNNGYYNQAKNGQFKFERSDFSWTGSEVKLEFRGYVNGYLVIGETTVKVQK